MPSASIKFTGEKEMIRRMRRLARRYPKEASRALRMEAEDIMTKAKREHVPVNLGTLRASGHVKPPKTIGREIEVTMAFGGPSSPYALAVHEHPSSHSPPSWQGKGVGDIRSIRTGEAWSESGKGPKYLERPLRAAITGMAGRVASDIRRRVQ